MSGDQSSTLSRSRVRVWRDGNVVEDGQLSDTLDRRMAEPGSLVWVDLVNPSTEDLDRLAAEIGLDPLAVEDATAPLERPKVVRHTGHLFFMTYATRLRDASVRDAQSHGRLELDRVSGFVLPSALITVRPDDAIDIDEVVRLWDDNPDLLRLGPGALVHGLLDHVVDRQFETIQQLDDAIEGLEDALFGERRGNAPFLRDVYGVRKDLVRLRRVVLPMREVVNALLRHRQDGDGELGRWYDDLYDHVLRAAEWTESLRDMVSSVFETNLSLQDTRLNVVMKQLAGWAAIIAVPTAVTGWFGQNLPYPGFAKPLGLWLSVLLIAGLSGGLFAVFRRRGWL